MLLSPVNFFHGAAMALLVEHQVTIPVDVLREVGFRVGEELVFKVEDNKVVIERKFQGHRILSLSGFLGGIYNDYDHEAEMADAWED